MNVVILATCRKPELFRMATLVFDTLRIGFPTAHVTVCMNRLNGDTRDRVLDKCGEAKAVALEVDTIHHKWIESLVAIENEPFFILDTDVIFYRNFEQFDFSSSTLAGWRIPEWRDEFSGCTTRARLHTSLLYIDPVKLRRAIGVYESPLAQTEFTPRVNLFYPLIVPVKGRAYFYDTCSMLYQAIGGTDFTDEQKEAYCHFNFGTIPDVVLPRLPKAEASQMEQARQCILSNPSFGKGAWRHQELFYANRRP